MTGDPDGTGDLPIPGLFDGFAAIDVDIVRVRFAGAMGGRVQLSSRSME